MSKVVVTGGAGFLGSHVVDELQEQGFNPTIIRSKEYDLTTEAEVVRMYMDHKPEIVIHLAAVVGGIGINREMPGTFYYKNLIMGALLIEYARRTGVNKFVSIGTICSYPRDGITIPFKEDDIWNGYPEETNAPYGIAKKAMLVQCKAYRQEFGFNGIHILPVNLYGPRDNFDIRTAHVVPALIRKCIEAQQRNEEYIECWGTGNATREFIYAKDAAKGIVLATMKYNSSEPLNIGTGKEIAIKDLVRLIADVCEYKGQIKWNTSYPDGQPRRCLDITKAQESIGFNPTTELIQGLKNTVSWYRSLI